MGALYHAIALHLVLNERQAAGGPILGYLPEGHLNGTLSADASQAAPPVAVTLRAPALALAPLLAALGEPAYASGNLEVYADLHGAGATPHAIAAGLDGSLGLSMVNGSVDNRVLGSTLGAILREVNLLDLVGRGGTSQVQCFAMRLDASHGIATSVRCGSLTVVLTMDGDGSINLGTETLDLMSAEARLAGTGLVIPLHVIGSRARHPRGRSGGGGCSECRHSGGRSRWERRRSGWSPALGWTEAGRGEAADCSAALALARGQASGSAPVPRPRNRRRRARRHEAEGAESWRVLKQCSGRS